MSRYFLEVSYLGTAYSGFQVQENPHTVQAEVESAMQTFFRKKISLTCSSRTDAGVHARQNFFHFDLDEPVDKKAIYHINALLPQDVSVKGFLPVSDEAHCRFDAISRTYLYVIYRKKDPFLFQRGYYFPYRIDVQRMQHAAEVFREYHDFKTFSKRRTQVKTFECNIVRSEWTETEGRPEFTVTANRFLRGMVRGMVGTMLRVGRGLIDVDELRRIIESGDPQRADFSVPGHGLWLMGVAMKGVVGPEA